MKLFPKLRLLPRLLLQAALLSSMAHAATSVPLTSGLDASAFDTGVRPQDDLFRAVNGHWLATYELPADKARYGSFNQLRDLSDERVRAIVEELVSKPLARKPVIGSLEQKIADTYASHLDTAALDRAGLKPIQPLLTRLDAVKDLKQLAQWQGSMQGQLSLPFNLNVSADYKEPSINRVSASQGGLGLPDRDYYLNKQEPRLAKAFAAYEQYLSTLARLSGEAEPLAAAQRVLAIEQALAQAQWSRVQNRDPAKRYNPMSVAELQAQAAGFDWAAFMQAAGLEAQTSLSVSQPSTATATAKLLSELPLADWKLYFKLRSLDAAAVLLPKEFREARFAFRDLALSGTPAEMPRWQRSIAELNGALGEGVGQLYVARHFSPEHKAGMQALVANLLLAYRESIDGLSWMSPATKASAQEKLAKFTPKIGYPEQWRDYSALKVIAGDALGNAERAAAWRWQRQVAKAGKPVDRSEWGMTPQTVNASYSPSFNAITFPAAILQPPFFDINADDAVNYGGIGAVIGHEISHGFDDSGSQFDGDGALRNWWGEADRKAFEAIAAKLAAQFDGYSPIAGQQINGKLTLGENIADLSGLQIAYKAYRHSLQGKPAPVIGGQSGEQRFFYGFAQVWRGKTRDEQTLQQLLSDPHSPAEFRANGTPINHDGFHEAFGTKAGDKMFKPEAERIRIW
ncbi:M13 family metallopeptidase [Roseateles oligotrophus]|uniref:M13 family metallopeptidase n=1 Tax=Roseateles oligotrophus TaxID=1769250 RepID=A0ABT2YA49_9BURK|nr:M13 family metallopeptidase [Roseateles oligotrophus]MCV2367180.1 M13 family metallopeptidase [Roseateles oligotrophus]